MHAVQGHMGATGHVGYSARQCMHGECDLELRCGRRRAVLLQLVVDHRKSGAQQVLHAVMELLDAAARHANRGCVYHANQDVEDLHERMSTT